ncbi:hypothetical protein GOP47_0016124 [Adiantum capillus-veneris]|uniref:Methyltransferase type 11 domain-containing protein n=1 Tax=Adiantum capillus-veneris TaxID=13818 RepID=A0A9D4UKX8_ADICA|nr:hypothetical protein GOP47_0016124 [Adiantum capillus-veneris]
MVNGSEPEPLRESRFSCTRPSTSQGMGESAGDGDLSLTMNLYSKARLSFVMQHAKEVARQRRVRIEDLQSLDLLHYSGMSAVKSFVEEQSKSWLSFPMRLLDVGAGIGGPARFLASHFDLAVITAVEYIPEQARVLSELNELCLLTDRINVVCADFLEIEFHAEKHGLLVSQLSFLHMANKSLLFKKCNESLNESGSMFVEDFYA